MRHDCDGTATESFGGSALLLDSPDAPLFLNGKDALKEGGSMHLAESNWNAWVRSLAFCVQLCWISLQVQFSDLGSLVEILLAITPHTPKKAHIGTWHSQVNSQDMHCQSCSHFRSECRMVGCCFWNWSQPRPTALAPWKLDNAQPRRYPAEHHMRLWCDCGADFGSLSQSQLSNLQYGSEQRVWVGWCYISSSCFSSFIWSSCKQSS